MSKNYTVIWWEANFPLITHRPIRLYLLKGPLYTAHENISLGREVQWNSWFVLQLSSVSAKYNFFPDNAANGVIIYTTRLFQKHVHRSSLNSHSLKINQAAGTSEWAVREECMSDRQTDPPCHSRKWWEGDGWTNNRNKNLDEPFGLINPPSPFSPPLHHQIASARKDVSEYIKMPCRKYLKDRYPEGGRLSKKRCLLLSARSVLSFLPPVVSSEKPTKTIGSNPLLLQAPCHENFS